MSFRSRPIAAPETVGERLRQLREEANLTIDDLAEELSIAAKHLQAIEESRYQDLPGKVYARNFVRQYIARMDLNQAAAMERFEQEYAVVSAPQQRRNPLLPQRAQVEHPWWYRHGRLLMAGAVVVVVIGYFAWQIVQLLTPPALAVTDPAQDTSVTAATLTVRGNTEPNTEVKINNGPVEVAANGSFSVTVDLRVGLNTLKITAKKKRSGERVVVRQVLREEPKTP